MWAEMQNLKSEMRSLNAKVEELGYQSKSQQSAVGADLSGRVARVESQVTQMASQLAIDIEGAHPAQAAMAPTTSGAAAMTGAPAAPYNAQGVYPGQAVPRYNQPGAQSYGADQGEDDEGVPAQPGYPQTAPYAPAQTGYQQTAPYAPAQTAPYAQAASPAATGAPVLNPPKDPADALYTQALQAFNNKQYREALSMWTEFTKNFSKSPLVPNTYFWIGECNYQVNDFANAVLSYQEVIDKYPKSNKYPDALFKRGAAFVKLNNKQAAKISFQELITKFPNSPLAQRAKAMMPK
jgi:tol-pal system protein YbgF